MEKTIKILMDRDGVSYEEAKKEVLAFISDAQEALANGEDGDYIDELLMDTLGLEPDFIPDLLF